MGAQHTPGPWRVEAQYGEPVILCGEEGGVEEIAIITSEKFSDTGAERVPPNARLIAAAPQMLEALKALVPADFDDHPEDFMPDWHAARAAIAAATGEAY